MTTPKFPKTVAECHKVINRLREENALLRQAGSSFGKLAERLSRALQEERRLGQERRQLHRNSEDRRAGAADENAQTASPQHR